MPESVSLVMAGILLVHLIPSTITAEDTENNNNKCSTLPQVQHRLNAVIVDCQNQVKEDMIRDALQQIRFTSPQQQGIMETAPEGGYPMVNPALAADRGDINWMVKRYKRDLGGASLYDHPTIMSSDDKEIAGVSIVIE